MERSTIIASVIAGAGILIAGSVAGTAAVNAAASSEPEPSSSQLLAAPAVIAPAPVADLAPLPAFTTEPLPEINAPAKPQKAPAGGESEAPAATPDAVPVAQATLPPEQAVALVLAATGGGSTQDVRQVTRAGYEAWAVTVQRPDRSVVTGFVDRASANVFDWRVVQAAPVTVAYTDDDEKGEYEDEDHGEEHEKSEKDDHDEHEGDEDDD
jgi:hypothetical protein